SSDATALAAYRQLQGKYASILGGREPRVLHHGLARGSMGWARVHVGTESRAGAEKLCAELRAAGGSGTVLRNSITSSASADRLSALPVAEPVLRPAGLDACLVVWRRPHRGRKALAAPLGPTGVLPGAGGVDQHPVPKPRAELRHVAIFQRRAGIDGRAEDPREDDQPALAGVHAMRERPFHLLVVGWVDVLLHHDDVLVAILAGAVAPERRPDLLWLALVVLLDLNADVDAVGDRRRIDVEDAGDAGAVEDVPGDGGALHRGHDAVLAVGARQRAFERAAEDRIATVRNARDLHGRARRGEVRHIAGELPERTFGLEGRRVVADGPLDDDLRARRNLEIDRLATHQLRRLAPISAHHVPLAYTWRNR